MEKINFKTSSTVFVFGSNQAGRHGKGAALFAKEEFDARYGVGEGLSGRAYGIPTKDFNIRTRALPDIAESVSKFLSYAKKHSKTTFFVTRIGCELAGYSDVDIAPMFSSAPSNCILPAAWAHHAGRKVKSTVLILPGIDNIDLHKIMANLSLDLEVMLIGSPGQLLLDGWGGFQVSGLPNEKIKSYGRFFENFIDMVMLNDEFTKEFGDLDFSSSRKIIKLTAKELASRQRNRQSVFRR